MGIAAVVGGVVAGEALGSRPETPTGGPLSPCGQNPNCARARLDLETAPDVVKRAARSVLEDVSAAEIRETENGWTATSRVGPFTDDLEVAVVTAGSGSVLWVRSAARLGRTDLGVNARRVRRVLEAVRRRSR